MNVTRCKTEDDINALSNVFEAWQLEGKEKAEHFGFNLDVLCHSVYLLKMVQLDMAAVFILRDNDKPCGYMGCLIYESPIGRDNMASEHFWYVLPEYRGSARLLLDAAMAWARENDCQHFHVTASRLAGDRYEHVCRLYGHLGFEPFESSFIKRL
jgi:GNAT superfamily N-acetyltransferase